ncbi:MAG TPA: hypothetical protein VFG03_20075 [Telluria sp.]|nr:hypothetical protein [Telluria sp.]
MNATKFIAAAAVFLAAGAAFAADAPAAAGTDTAIAAASLNLPSVQINTSLGRPRAEVKAEAVEFVKNYQTTLSTQLDQYKN